MIQFQAILKNGKNGSKLFDTPLEAVKYYPNQLEKLKEITVEDFTNIKTGNRNKRGRQFAMRANGR
tara:strand:+ start:84 stop:281 length:198 start_codon:yes stop_codon:yes gene_type:complete